MEFTQILNQYHQFIESSLKDRFFKHSHIEHLIRKYAHVFKIRKLGNSNENRSIHLLSWGEGKTKVLLWSQMHGNEPTGTMAIFDLLNFILQNLDKPEIIALQQNCSLHFIPMVNPDGAERFIRRNANQIDLNRDYLDAITIEASILKKIRDEINPDFGFNLHDQSTLWSVKNSLEPATISFLAPAYNEECSVNKVRERAMLVIADIYSTLSKFIPKNIGLFDETFEPRAFGDNFQKKGTSTLLIEAGGLQNDPEKQNIRKYYFLSILKGLLSISNQTYLNKSVEDYRAISSNAKQLYHIIIERVSVNGVETNMCLNFEENNLNHPNVWVVHDIGNTTGYNGYTKFLNGPFKILEYVEVDKEANFKLLKDNEIILVFKNGKLVDSTLQIN
ncbi:M14 family zinc carboxypeptidase [Pedobacter flavus]|uniref:M14 family zinc carboxypeptidase n=1 Tax=Pedobacter flavus TaxID=3113906 RepID=A0ABU7H3T2_9SPHI|nr:M14 family zinc carboxypeptidase [Pedobacter sp. VNH31]MEE1885873.1 M14 family zinc carboxypeptidase [Pedobacter sp. VNH31]